MKLKKTFLLSLVAILTVAILQPSSLLAFKLIKKITGSISPKSVVHSGNGLFFAQNMMYNHTITVYNRDFKLVKTIPDSVRLSDYGHSKYSGSYRGAPVEAIFTNSGKYAWISNYNMYGRGFNNEGHDKCDPSQKKDHSYVYKINTETFKIEKVIQVGSVPKFITASPDGRYVIVSNWCSYDIHVIDTASDKVVKRVYVGRYPRGLAVDPTSEKLYIAVMGSYNIGVLDLKTYKLSFFKGVGRSPRHLNISPDGKYLYATLNGEGRVAKISLPDGTVLKKIATGSAPRSMVLSNEGKFMYVVNYHDDTVSKVDTQSMKVLATLKTNHHPIGITYDAKTKQVWVACYAATIMVFQD